MWVFDRHWITLNSKTPIPEQTWGQLCFARQHISINFDPCKIVTFSMFAQNSKLNFTKMYLLRSCSRGMETSRNSPDRWCVQLQPGWTQPCWTTPLALEVWGAVADHPQGSSGLFGPLTSFGPYRPQDTTKPCQFIKLSIISSFWQAYWVQCTGDSSSKTLVSCLAHQKGNTRAKTALEC